MVSNPGYFSQMASGGALTQVEDGVDNPHTGLIKALSLGMGGNYPISGFDATSVTATTATIANGVIFRDGSKVSITGGGITLSTTYTTGYHLLVARASGIVLINPAAVDKVPEYASGDVVIGIFAHTGTNPMSIQYLSIDKTENSLSIGYDSSGYTEAGTITGDANGVTITGLFKLDTLPTATPATGDKVIIQDTDDADKIKTVTTQQIRDLAPTTSETLQTVTDSGATTTNSITANSFVKTGGTSSEFLKADGSVDSNVYLTTESDTLQSVTDRGDSTSRTITVANLVSNGWISGDQSVEGIATMGSDDLYYFINTPSIQLPQASTMAKRLLFLKNITGATAQVIPYGGEWFDAIYGVAPTGLSPNPDQRVTPAAITLESGESVILTAVTDATYPLVNGYYVLSLDTNASSGIADVVDDTTPQLGGDLDTNGNNLTGNFSATGETRLLKGSVVTTNNPIYATHAGCYILITGPVTLPNISAIGEQYVLMNNSGSAITISPSAPDLIIGSTSVPDKSAVTIIAIDLSNWFVIG